MGQAYKRSSAHDWGWRKMAVGQSVVLWSWLNLLVTGARAIK
jgi:hypothetical protein